MSVPSGYTQTQINQSYVLTQLQDLQTQTELINGDNAANQIVIGDAAFNVPAGANNVIVIGDGDKSNLHDKDITLGDGVTVQAGDLAGTLHLGAGMAAASAPGDIPSTHTIPLYYNGVRYNLLASNV